MICIANHRFHKRTVFGNNSSSLAGGSSTFPTRTSRVSSLILLLSHTTGFNYEAPWVVATHSSSMSETSYGQRGFASSYSQETPVPQDVTEDTHLSLTSSS